MIGANWGESGAAAAAILKLLGIGVLVVDTIRWQKVSMAYFHKSSRFSENLISKLLGPLAERVNKGWTGKLEFP